jgi:hypothetical protein
VALSAVLLKAEDLVISNPKEESWMTVYEHERDLLEDTVYRRLVSLWSEFSDAQAVFDQHGPAQHLSPKSCALSRYGKLFSLHSLSRTRACKLSFLPVRSDAVWRCCCLLVLDSVTSTPQCIRQPRPRVYLKKGTYHMFRFCF